MRMPAACQHGIHAACSAVAFVADVVVFTDDANVTVTAAISTEATTATAVRGCG